MDSKEDFLNVIVLDKMLWGEIVLIKNLTSIDVSSNLLLIAVDKASHFIWTSVIHADFSV